MNEQVTKDHIFDLISKVNQHRASEDYCDVEIHVEGKAFKCHRLILASASEYFHIMFGGKFKESTASVVTLQEVEAATFEKILQFIYTGNLTIDSANLYEMVRAGEFFTIPHLEELCIRYVQQNESTLIENGLELLRHIRPTGSTKFGKFLVQCIYKNFDYFLKTPEFLKMSVEDFTSILNLIPTSPSMFQDTFMLAIMRWIRNITDHSTHVKRLYLYELLKRISFTNLSSDCVEHFNRINYDNFFENKGIDETATVDFKCFHVYVRAISHNLLIECPTSAFTLYRHFGAYKWCNSYQYDSNYSPYFMRTIEQDGHLYCLSFNGTSAATETGQLFKSCSSISLFSNSYLKPPPLILRQYDMCGSDNHNIYVYNKDPCSVLTRRAYASSFSNEELARGVLQYNREVDTWLPLPPPIRKMRNACMTCDGQRVYLIGGRNIYEQTYDNTDLKFVQCYDHRTPGWISLQSTHSAFEYSACCAYQNKIYVSGGSCDSSAVEMYDPGSGWMQLAPMQHDRRYHRMEPFIYSSRALVAIGGVLSSSSEMEIYDTVENRWMICTPSLYETVRDSDPQCRISFEIVDIVTYKPIGW